MSADLPQMELYRGIGRLVSARPEKGAAAAAAEYLTNTYPDASGFSPGNLRRMREFYRAYESAPEYQKFEDVKHINAYGIEFWYGRELAPVPDYLRWENFSKAIDHAMLACQNSGFPLDDHFREVTKMVELGSGSQRSIKDYVSSRYACYLTVQNGDPRKESIALGQTYFAVQTRRQQIADTFNLLDEDSRRLVIRGDIRQWNSLLAEAAHRAGITEQEEYAEFQNAGYMGLYGGLRVSDIHRRKGLKETEKILDHMGSVELAANLVRITQTEEKLVREQTQGLDDAAAAHYRIGREKLKQLRKDRKKLMLDEWIPGASHRSARPYD